MSRALWLGSLVAVALGCSHAEEPAAHREALEDGTREALEPSLAPSQDPSRDTVEAEAVEPAVATSPLLAALPEASRQTLERSRLPALLPPDEELLAHAVITAGPHFIAFSARTADGVSVAIHGSDQRHPLVEEIPPPAPTDQVRGRGAVVTANDGIRTVAWDEADIAWALDVECEDPAGDARCAEEGYVRALAERLERIGGGP